MFIAAQQRNTNIVPELLKWEVALPPPSLTIPTTGAVKFAIKASVVQSLVSFTEKHPSNNAAIFIDRDVTSVIIDASVLIRRQRPKNLRTATGRLKKTRCSWKTWLWTRYLNSIAWTWCLRDTSNSISLWQELSGVAIKERDIVLWATLLYLATGPPF